MSAMNGLSDIRSGYFTRSRNGGSPLARPVTTYCFWSSSRRFARRRRIIAAVPEVPMTTTGIHRCSSTDTNFGQLMGWSTNSGSIRPPIDVPNTTFAKYRSTRARRKFGVASPRNPISVRPWIAPTVLVGRGVDPDGERDHPGEDDGREREQKGQEQAVPHHLADREVVLERVPEVPMQHPQHPGRVLLDHGAVEPVVPAQELDLLLRHPLAGGLQLGDVGAEVVALGKLDDDEHQGADDHQGGDHHEDASDRVLEHQSSNQKVSGR